MKLSFYWTALFAVLCVNASGREDKNDVHHSMYNTMGYGLELLLTKFDIISSKLQRVDEKLQSMEDNLKSMEDKMQKSEIKMLQKVEDEIQEHRSSQTKNHKETFAAIKKLERQFAHNLSEIHNRNQENINAVLHKLDKDIGSVLHNQYRIPYATSCKGVPSNVTGTYLLRIKSASEPFEVYCEQKAFDGGWIVMQFRFDGSLDFYRGWNEFRDGFGDLRKEFWLGLEKVHQIIRGRNHELMIELKDFNGTYVYARYDAFEIGSESEQYKLKDIGKYRGTAGDEMTNYMGMKFSTKDRDNDDWNTVHCAQEREGAWWHGGWGCTSANLNGRYIDAIDAKSMHWFEFNKNVQGLSYSRMMIREFE